MERQFQTPIVTEIITPWERQDHDPFIDEYEIKSPVNLWIRTNMEQFCPETEALVPDHRREAYRTMTGELLVSGGLLNDNINSREARTRYEAAQAARCKFFEETLDEVGMRP